MRKLIFIFSLLALLGIVFRNINSTKEKNIETMTVSILKKCKDFSRTLNSLNPGCMANEFESFVTKENVGEIMDVLESVFSLEKNATNLGNSSCHAPGHLIGKIAFNKGMTLGQFWEVCSTKCGYGCLHGAFIGSFENQGKSFLTDYKEACRDAVFAQNEEHLRSCWHVVGHGLAEVFGEDIEGVVAKCLSLDNESTRSLCVDGVRMEYLTSVSNPSMESLPAGKIISFCQRFPEVYQNDCFAESAYYTFRVSGKESDTIGVCSKVPAGVDIKKRCAFGGGAIFAYTLKDSPREIINRCRKYQDPLVESCVLGAVEILAGPENFLKSAIDLCGLLGGVQESGCLAFFGDRLQFASGVEKRKEVCSSLVKQKESSCMKKPTYSEEYLEGIII